MNVRKVLAGVVMFLMFSSFVFAGALEDYLKMPDERSLGAVITTAQLQAKIVAGRKLLESALAEKDRVTVLNSMVGHLRHSKAGEEYYDLEKGYEYVLEVEKLTGEIPQWKYHNLYERGKYAEALVALDALVAQQSVVDKDYGKGLGMFYLWIGSKLGMKELVVKGANGTVLVTADMNWFKSAFPFATVPLTELIEARKKRKDFPQVADFLYSGIISSSDSVDKKIENLSLLINTLDVVEHSDLWSKVLSNIEGLKKLK